MSGCASGLDPSSSTASIGQDAGICQIQSGIFAENVARLALHQMLRSR